MSFRHRKAEAGHQPAFLTRMTSPRLIFGSTRNFPQLEIHSVFHSFGKLLVNPNPYAIISPPDEKCGLVPIDIF
jgi:hypothetical protein